MRPCVRGHSRTGVCSCRHHSRIRADDECTLTWPGPIPLVEDDPNASRRHEYENVPPLSRGTPPPHSVEIASTLHRMARRHRYPDDVNQNAGGITTTRPRHKGAEPMRKFLTNGAILSSVFGIVGVVRQTSMETKRWRAVLVWLAWGISTALAISAVMDDANQKKLELD